MSVFAPRNILGVVGAMLALIALYLVLVHFIGADGILKSIANGSVGLVTALQGRG